LINYRKNFNFLPDDRSPDRRPKCIFQGQSSAFLEFKIYILGSASWNFFSRPQLLFIAVFSRGREPHLFKRHHETTQAQNDMGHKTTQGTKRTKVQKGPKAQNNPHFKTFKTLFKFRCNFSCGTFRDGLF
jgi:hypothetical protein